MNLQSSDAPGTHWVAIRRNDSFNPSLQKGPRGTLPRYQYFDPLGFPPDEKAHKAYLNLSWTAKRVQSDSSNLCGYHCVAWLARRPFKEIGI